MKLNGEQTLFARVFIQRAIAVQVHFIAGYKSVLSLVFVELEGKHSVCSPWNNLCGCYGLGFGVEMRVACPSRAHHIYLRVHCELNRPELCCWWFSHAFQLITRSSEVRAVDALYRPVSAGLRLHREFRFFCTLFFFTLHVAFRISRQVPVQVTPKITDITALVLFQRPYLLLLHWNSVDVQLETECLEREIFLTGVVQES